MEMVGQKNIWCTYPKSGNSREIGRVPPGKFGHPSVCETQYCEHSSFIYSSCVYIQKWRYYDWWNWFRQIAFEGWLDVTIVCSHRSDRCLYTQTRVKLHRTALRKPIIVRQSVRWNSSTACNPTYRQYVVMIQRLCSAKESWGIKFKSLISLCFYSPGSFFATARMIIICVCASLVRTKFNHSRECYCLFDVVY